MRTSQYKFGIKIVKYRTPTEADIGNIVYCCDRPDFYGDAGYFKLLAIVETATGKKFVVDNQSYAQVWDYARIEVEEEKPSPQRSCFCGACEEEAQIFEDVNEDDVCVHCNQPVKERLVFCSNKCARQFGETEIETATGASACNCSEDINK